MNALHMLARKLSLSYIFIAHNNDDNQDAKTASLINVECIPLERLPLKVTPVYLTTWVIS